MLKSSLLLVTLILLVGNLIIVPLVLAATPLDSPALTTNSSSTAASASLSANEQAKIDKLEKENITKPEESEAKQEVFALFGQRPADHLTFFNSVAYAVQFAVKQGVPANTVVLILLLPLLASIVAFIRHIVGLPSLEMLVPVTLSVTLIATGITAGFALLLAVLIASFVSRMLLKKVRIMQLPKMALSILIVAAFVLGALTITATIGILAVKQLSIFPVLIFILLSDKIVALQLERTMRSTIYITSITIMLGLLGYILLSSTFLRNIVLLYPELVLLLIPVNILIGRYFGLRLAEYFRFAPIRNYGNK